MTPKETPSRMLISCNLRDSQNGSFHFSFPAYRKFHPNGTSGLPIFRIGFLGWATGSKCKESGFCQLRTSRFLIRPSEKYETGISSSDRLRIQTPQHRLHTHTTATPHPTTPSHLTPTPPFPPPPPHPTTPPHLTQPDPTQPDPTRPDRTGPHPTQPLHPTQPPPHSSPLTPQPACRRLPLPRGAPSAPRRPGTRCPAAASPATRRPWAPRWA